MKFKNLSLLVFFLLLGTLIKAQTLPVGLLENTDDLIRRQQLLGWDTSKYSLMIRPIAVTKGKNVSLVKDEISIKDLNKTIWSNAKGNAMLQVLPIVWHQQMNTHHPYGLNDGAMINSKGYQTLLSGGIFAKFGVVSIQLRPEYVYAQNSNFTQTFEADNEPKLKELLTRYHNVIDAPERFGSGSYSKLDWGQSSIRLNFDPISIGLSNENLWWGPGTRNSLLMTNNASGFKHLTLNTTRPIRTAIGDFEGQIIAGKLEGSGVKSTLVQTAKPDDWRYLSGMVLTYQPKWIPGLYLGLDRTFIAYQGSMGSSFSDYFPLFSSLTKKNFGDEAATFNREDNYKRDQLFSLFAKWVMPESRSEIYFQYGKEDHAWNLRDEFVELENSRAYVAGFRKLIPFLSKPNEFIQLGIELTQMEPAGVKEVRGQASWYTHSQVRHGYTHRGQIIGSGLGPDNLQSIDVAWVNGLKRIGFMLERRTHNNGLYYEAFKGTSEPRRHWVDLGIGAKFDWDFKRFIFNSQMIYTHSYNYQYRIEGINPNFWAFDSQDANNLHLKIGVLYRF